MMVEMKVLIFGSEKIRQRIIACFEYLGYTCTFLGIDDQEALRSYLQVCIPGLIVVASSGAAGMEAVFLIRKIRSEVPVFWFSDDGDFSLQSHRLECEYFAQMPITPEKLEAAFRRCAHVGVQFP